MFHSARCIHMHALELLLPIIGHIDIHLFLLLLGIAQYCQEAQSRICWAITHCQLTLRCKLACFAKLSSLTAKSPHSLSIPLVMTLRLFHGFSTLHCDGNCASRASL